MSSTATRHEREMMADDIELPKLVLNPAARRHRQKLNVAKSIIGGDVDRTIEGASTLTVKVRDMDRKILKSNLLELQADDRLGDIDVKLDGLRWRLVQVKKQGDDLDFIFEELEVNLLRTGKGKPLKAKRGKTTRNEFILSLIRRIKGHKIKTRIHELHKTQPLVGEASDDKERDRQERREPGIPRNAKLQIWTTTGTYRARSSQIKLGERALDIAETMGAGLRAKVALIAALMVESQIQNLGGGEGTSVGALQLTNIHYGGSVSERRNFDRIVKQFLQSGFTGQGGAIANEKRGHSVQDIAQRSQGSDHPSRYGQAAATAQRWVEVYGGSDVALKGRSTGKRKAVYFRRAGDETTWDAIQRLVSEVGWRAFVVSGVLHVISEEDLFKSKPRFLLAEDDPAVIYIDGDWDQGKKASTLEVTANIKRWMAPPGTVCLVEELGPFNGRWLVTNVQRPLFSSEGRITLSKPVREKAEPLGEKVRERNNADGADGGGGGSFQEGSGQATGSFQRPVPYPINSPFGQRWGRLHDGVDMACPAGTPIRAADGGKVTVAGWYGGYGHYVKINHGNGLETFYGHMQRINTRVGARVSKGQVIGYVDSTGSSTGNHLHFGVHRNGAPVNPANYL